MIPRSTDWMKGATCAGRPGDYDRDTYSVRGETFDPLTIIALCADCPVAAQCAADALAYPTYAHDVIRAGIIARQYNTSPTTRMKMKRHLAYVANGVAVETAGALTRGEVP